MERREVPAVRTVGIQEFGHGYGKLWQELPAGGVIRLVSVRPGIHRAWIAPEPPPGSEPEQVSVRMFIKSLGRYLDDIRGGAVYEIRNDKRHVTRGYAFWSCPDELASVGWLAVIPYMARTRGGLAERGMYPLAVEAEPLPPRRGHGRALANA